MVGDEGWGSSLGLLPSLFWRLSTKTADSLLGEWAEQRQRWASGGLAKKLAEGENKSCDTVELESRRDLAMATPQECFPFYTSTEMQRSSQPIEVGICGAIRRW
jgi:hypothetical protein